MKWLKQLTLTRDIWHVWNRKKMLVRTGCSGNSAWSHFHRPVKWLKSPSPHETGKCVMRGMLSYSLCSVCKTHINVYSWPTGCFFNIQTDTGEQMGTQKNQKLINSRSCCCSCCWLTHRWQKTEATCSSSIRQAEATNQCFVLFFLL